MSVVFSGFSRTFRHLSAVSAAVAALTASAAMAQQAPRMSPPKLDIEAFLAQSAALHDSHPQTPASVTARGTGDAATVASAQAAPPAALPKAQSAAIDRILTLATGNAGEIDKASVARGLTTGQAHMPVVPAQSDLDHATAQAVVAAFQRPSGMTAEDSSQIAAGATIDPAVAERIGLVRTLYRVDGTDPLIRHFIATEHMRLIITEVNNHIDISSLSDSEKYRMSAIAASAETELEEKVLNLDARVQAANLTKPELLNLITAFDNDAQRKLIKMRLSDTGKTDRAIDLDMRLGQIQIIKAMESAR